MSICTVIADGAQADSTEPYDGPVYGETIAVTREDNGDFAVYFGGPEHAADLITALTELPAGVRLVDIVTTYHCDDIDCPGVVRNASDQVHNFPSTIMKFRVDA